MTRPSAETKEPEPPLLKRTEAFCTCSSQPLGNSKPYLALRILRGGLLKSHMPSSAIVALASMVHVRAVRETIRKFRMRTYSFAGQGVGLQVHALALRRACAKRNTSTGGAMQFAVVDLGRFLPADPIEEYGQKQERDNRDDFSSRGVEITLPEIAAQVESGIEL